MGDSDCRLGLVYMLTTCTARTVGIDLKVFWIDFNLNVIHFRQNSNGNGGCVDTALCFGFRYTLYTVNTRFKFEFGVSSFTVDGEADFLVATQFGWVCVEDLDLPALAFCIHRVHSEPVSYTHLDVYKRQIEFFFLLCYNMFSQLHNYPF